MCGNCDEGCEALRSRIAVLEKQIEKSKHKQEERIKELSQGIKIDCPCCRSSMIVDNHGGGMIHVSVTAWNWTQQGAENNPEGSGEAAEGALVTQEEVQYHPVAQKGTEEQIDWLKENREE